MNSKSLSGELIKITIPDCVSIRWFASSFGKANFVGPKFPTFGNPSPLLRGQRRATFILLPAYSLRGSHDLRRNRWPVAAKSSRASKSVLEVQQPAETPELVAPLGMPRQVCRYLPKSDQDLGMAAGWHPMVAAANQGWMVKQTHRSSSNREPTSAKPEPVLRPEAEGTLLPAYEPFGPPMLRVPRD